MHELDIAKKLEEHNLGTNFSMRRAFLIGYELGVKKSENNRHDLCKKGFHMTDFMGKCFNCKGQIFKRED